MLRTLFAIRTPDPDQHFRGMLLKGITLILGIGSLLDMLLVAIESPQSPIFLGTLVGSIAACIVFGLAHIGRINMGAIILAVTFLAITCIVVPEENLIYSPIILIFLFPILIVGLTIDATASALFGSLTVIVLGVLLLVGYIPQSSWSLLAILLLTITTTFLWLVLFTLERGRNQARKQAHDLQAAQNVILAREDDLQATNQQMQKKNADLEHMLELVNQLETPIIPLTDESLIVPLVGHLDTRRIEHIREMVLANVYQSHARFVLIDLTGIAIIDTGVISRLNHIIKCIHLLGTEVLLTGIRADTAITMTTLGIDFADVWTSANLSDGVRHVLRQVAV